MKNVSASGLRKLFYHATHLTSSILGTIREVCPQSLQKKNDYMTEWMLTMILATNGTRIGSIKTLILPTPQNKLWATSSREAEFY